MASRRAALQAPGLARRLSCGAHDCAPPHGGRHIVLPSSQPVLMRARDRSVPASLRADIRSGAFRGQTSGLAAGFVQCNFVALPRNVAFDFLVFCLRNPKPCPLVEVLDPGDPEPKSVAPGADVRRDIPKYRIWRGGELAEEVDDISPLWTHDMVGFLLGCSFSWEDELERAGCVPRHIERKKNVPMFNTSWANQAAGVFEGKLVVSMRPYRPDQLDTVRHITSRYPLSHGGPIHAGDPQVLGIAADTRDWSLHPDFGDGVDIKDDEIPVFWACGVTPQTAVMQAKLPLAITHAPGHMFITDLLTEEIAQAPLPVHS
eukprot:Tamp_22647.p1 GENE.Tamp_22647~~Tamp_22647.p1  ORF type:complete len:317 (+),score=60.64 Tamp_22647:62-1012(+)